MEKRAKKIQVLVDLGRIPSKIATGEGFSGYTADQWRSFIMIYATPIMWDLLDEADRKILANFVRACTLLRIAQSSLPTAPSSLPNSKCTIELELLQIIVQNSRLDSLISAQSDNAKLMNALPLVQSRLTTGSLAAYDGFDFNELYHFMQNFHQNIDNTITTGSEEFPGEMLTPRNRVSLPNATYELLNFTSIADLASSDLSSGDSNQSIVVLPIVTQFGRIRIAAKIFGSKSAP
ncbi:hypothetical protein RirG_031800 [Rhizophagus irregularis DAOM 197198w]|uniref:Uncharacterized protein n=1 Tax=Rhizophagus irregularis (strain DAOM 197198w) TaxID=1432141 RepID=A0A015LA61_RHIIW|nr:hypothetical protein RirG_031800 [Rhizophagus irregularis DAOM 197198w]